MSEYRIRTAQENERAYIDNLNYDSFRVAFQLQENISDEEAYQRYRKIEDEDPIDPFGENHIVFIAIAENGEMAGLIWFAMREPFYAFKEPLVWIYNINIRPPHRGTGLSKKLLELAKNGQRKMGANRLDYTL